MERSTSEETAIACTLEAGAFKERIAWIEELNRAALLTARREGRRLILVYRLEHAAQVRELVRREQQCCRFLGFEVTERPHDVTLVIEAPEEVADALDAIFEPFEAASRGACRPSPS